MSTEPSATTSSAVERSSSPGAPLGTFVATLESDGGNRISDEKDDSQHLRQRLLPDTTGKDLPKTKDDLTSARLGSSKDHREDNMSTAEQLALTQALEESKRDRNTSRLLSMERSIEGSVEGLAVARAIEESKSSSLIRSTATSSSDSNSISAMTTRSVDTTPTTVSSKTTTTTTTTRAHERENAAIALAIAESKRQEYCGIGCGADDELARALEESKASHRVQTSASKRERDLEEDRVRRAIELSKRESEELERREGVRRLREDEELRHALALSLALSESTKAVSSISQDLMRAFGDFDFSSSANISGDRTPPVTKNGEEVDRELQEAIERSKYDVGASKHPEHVAKWLRADNSEDVEIWVVPKNALPSSPRSQLLKLADQEDQASKEREVFEKELDTHRRQFAMEKRALEKQFNDRSQTDRKELERLREEKAKLLKMEERARAESDKRIMKLREKEEETKRARQEFERELKRKEEEAERERAAIHDEWENKFKRALEAKETEMRQRAEEKLKREMDRMDAKLDTLSEREQIATTESEKFAATLARRTEELEKEKEALQKRWEDRSRMDKKELEALVREKDELRRSMDRTETESQKRLAVLEDKKEETKRARQEFERELKQAKETEMRQRAEEKLKSEKDRSDMRRSELEKRQKEREAQWATIDRRREEKMRSLMQRVQKQDQILAERESALREKTAEASSSSAKQKKVFVKSSSIISSLKRELAEQRAQMDSLRLHWESERKREQMNFLSQAKNLLGVHESKHAASVDEAIRMRRRARVQGLIARLRSHAWSIGRRVVEMRKSKIRECALKELLSHRRNDFKMQESKLKDQLVATRHQDDSKIDSDEFERIKHDLERAREKQKRAAKKLNKYKKKLDSVSAKAKKRLETKLRSASEQSKANFSKRMEEIEKMNAMLRKDLELERALRKKYHGEVETLRGKIRVVCRVRLEARDDADLSLRRIDDSVVKTVRGNEEFAFDAVVSSTSDFEFEDCWASSEADSLVRTAVDGYNICVCNYGPQSGRKSALVSSPDGLLKRSCESIFDRVDKDVRGGVRIEVYATAIEICGQKMLDMLRPQQSAWGRGNLSIEADLQGNVTIKNATRVRARSAIETMRTFSDALERRRAILGVFNTAEEYLGPVDTHAILQVFIERKELSEGKSAVGKFTFVDLADFDAPPRTGAIALDGGLSKNFAALARITESLSNGNKAASLAYDKDLLTRTLRDCIGGNAKTIFFVSVGDDDEDVAASTDALRYATKIRNVRNETHRVADLRMIEALKSEIQMGK
eukprot:g236.t1